MPNNGTRSYLIFILMFYIIPTLLLFNLLSLKDITLAKRDLTVMHDTLTSNTYITTTLYFTLISLSGLPFLAGFIGKWYIFEILIDYNNIMIVILLVLASIFANIFYIRIFFYISSRIRFSNLKIKKEKYIKYLLLAILGFINFSLILLQEPLIGGLLSLYS